MKKYQLLLLVVVLVGCQGAKVQSDDVHLTKSVCADSFEKSMVREYYGRTRPGAPLPIPARLLGINELKIASALSPSQSIGTDITPEQLKIIWRSIEKWGSKTRVGLVFSINNLHTFNFPSTIPMIQPSMAF